MCNSERKLALSGVLLTLLERRCFADVSKRAGNADLERSPRALFSLAQAVGARLSNSDKLLI